MLVRLFADQRALATAAEPASTPAPVPATSGPAVSAAATAAVPIDASAVVEAAQGPVEGPAGEDAAATLIEGRAAPSSGSKGVTAARRVESV